MADVTMRICSRVRTNPFLPLEEPSAALRKAIIADTCSRCDQKVWVDTAQPIPAHVPLTVVLICTECATDDPAVAPTLYQNLTTAYLKREFFGQTHAWLIDDGE